MHLSPVINSIFVRLGQIKRDADYEQEPSGPGFERITQQDCDDAKTALAMLTEIGRNAEKYLDVFYAAMGIAYAWEHGNAVVLSDDLNAVGGFVYSPDQDF